MRTLLISCLQLSSRHFRHTVIQNSPTRYDKILQFRIIFKVVVNKTWIKGTGEVILFLWTGYDLKHCFCAPVSHIACTVTSFTVQFIRLDFQTRFAIFPFAKGDCLYTFPLKERLLCTFTDNEFWDFLPRFTACPGAANLGRFPELVELYDAILFSHDSL